MNRLSAWALAAIAACAVTTATLAADPPRKERIAFAKGSTQATQSGTIRGYASVDYVVRAAAGQTLAVTLDAKNGQNNFNVLPPGSADVAMYASGTSGERSYKGVLPADGDYTIRVFLERAAARRNESSKYTLKVAVDGAALAALPAARDAKVKGTAFHATAQVRCVPPFASAPATCDAGVIRRGRDGTATVVLFGNNLVRRVLFVHGKVTASDAPDAVTATKKDDVNLVQVGDERYEIPDALLTGG